MHNRVGTYLSELESKNVRRDEPKTFKRGQIIVEEVQSETFKFVMFSGMTNNNTTKIKTKNAPTDDDIIDKDNVDIGKLFAYSRTEPITQNYKPTEANLNEADLLETYIIG